MRVQSIKLNLIPGGVMPVIHLSQYDQDTDGSIICMIYNGSIPYDLTGCTATIDGTKPDGTVYSYPCTVSQTYITSATYQQMTSVAGEYQAELRISKGEDIVGTLNFIISVEPAGISTTDLSKTDIPALLGSIQNAVDEAEYWAKEAAGSVAGVSSFNGRSGSVLPMAGDYDSEKILLASVLHIGEETQDNVQEALEALADNGGGGHTILNSAGEAMPQRKNLKFVNATVSDDEAGDSTNVTVQGGGTGGSSVTVSTLEPRLYGQPVTLTQGSTTLTSNFDASGHALFSGVTLTGLVSISASEGGDTAETSINIPYYGNYSAVLAFWAAPVTITTTTTEFDGLTVVVKKDGATVGAAVFSGGSASYVAPEPGTYTFEATLDWKTFSETLTVTAEQTYSVALNGFVATVNISTSSPELYGVNIVITASGVPTSSVAFSGAGIATYRALQPGTYTFTATQGGSDYSATLIISTQGTYSVTIDVSATLILECDATVMEGKTITATDGTTTLTATMTNGEATFKIADIGTWNIAGINVEVEQLGETYTEQLVLFAFHYSENDSSPESVTYPSGYDNSGFTDPLYTDLSSGVPHYGDWDPSGANADKLAWFYPKPCMLKYDGTVDYYLDENDETKKADGTASDVADVSYGGNAMMEWGQDGKIIHWKLIPDSDEKGFTFVIGNGQGDDAMKPWNHYDANGDITPHFYMSIYFGSSDGTRMRSISGQSNYVNNTRNAEVNLALANNPSGMNIWYTEVYADWLLQMFACWLASKSTASQGKFGSGRSLSSNTSAIGQGTMNGKGMFYGKSNGTEGVKVFGRENPWGNLWRGLAGLMYISGDIKAKLTYGQQDGSTVDGYNFTGAGYISLGSMGGTSGGYISHMHITDKMLAPATMSGAENTYYTDGGWFASGTMYALVGGAWSTAGRVGAACCYLSGAASYTDTSFGAALSCKPLAGAQAP